MLPTAQISLRMCGTTSAYPDVGTGAAAISEELSVSEFTTKKVGADHQQVRETGMCEGVDRSYDRDEGREAGAAKGPDYGGVRMPIWHHREAAEAFRALELRDTDVIICTYPKSGTTWIHKVRSHRIAVDTQKRGQTGLGVASKSAFPTPNSSS